MLILNQIFNLINSLYFFVWSELIAIFISLYTILLLYKKSNKERNFLYNTQYLLTIIIASAILENLAWLLSILKLTILPQFSLHLVLLTTRLAWVLTVFQYLAFGLFVEYLIPNQSKLLLIINRLAGLVCMVYSSVLIWLILFKPITLYRPKLELCLLESITNIYIPAMILICLFFVCMTLKNHALSYDLRHKLYTFCWGLVGPTILVDAIHIHLTAVPNQYLTNKYTLTAILALFVAITTFFCIKQILRKPLANGEL